MANHIYILCKKLAEVFDINFSDNPAVILQKHLDHLTVIFYPLTQCKKGPAIPLISDIILYYFLTSPHF